MRRCVPGRVLSLTLFAGFLATGAGAQLPELKPPSGAAPVHDVSVAEYRTHLDTLRALVAECGRVITACAPARVGSDDRVHGPNGSYLERYDWLRSLLEARTPAARTAQEQLLPHAAQRLSEQQAELEAAPVTAAVSPQDRSARDRVLRASEFQTVQSYSVTERLASWLSEKFRRLFGGAAALGKAAPWLGAALEWGSLVLVVVLLLVWVLRTLDRQRTALGRLSADEFQKEAAAESQAWADLAAFHAERREWRDAVHCIYWAAIVLLEDRRTLRHNSTRTPREALMILESSSRVSGPLRAMTHALERIWYGHAEATETDFAQALEQYRDVQNGSRTVTA